MNWLTILGKIDGGIAAAAAALGAVDKSHASIYLLVAGVAGAVGVTLNLVSHFLGGDDVTVKS